MVVSLNYDVNGQFMKRIASEGALSGKKTNHSVRKTTITSLASSNILDP